MSGMRRVRRNRVSAFQAPHIVYSQRSAVIGSVPEARRAGMTEAMMTVAIMTVTAARMLTGSAALYAVQPARDLTRDEQGDGHAERDSAGGQHEPLADHHAEHTPVGCTQRDAHADFARPPGDRVREGSVDTGCCQHEGQEGKSHR